MSLGYLKTLLPHLKYEMDYDCSDVITYLTEQNPDEEQT